MHDDPGDRHIDRVGRVGYHPNRAPVARGLEQVLGDVGHEVGFGATHLRRNVLRNLVVERDGYIGVENGYPDVEQHVFGQVDKLLGRSHVHDPYGVGCAAGYQHRYSERCGEAAPESTVADQTVFDGSMAGRSVPGFVVQHRGLAHSPDL